MGQTDPQGLDRIIRPPCSSEEVTSHNTHSHDFVKSERRMHFGLKGLRVCEKRRHGPTGMAARSQLASFRTNRVLRSTTGSADLAGALQMRCDGKCRRTLHLAQATPRNGS